MNTLVKFVLDHRRSVLAVWSLCLLAALPFAVRLPSVIQGSSEAIRGSESYYVARAMEREFGQGSAYTAVVVVRSETTTVQDRGFAEAMRSLESVLTARDDVRSVTHAWNSGAEELVGRDGRTALLLVQPRSGSLTEAESFTAVLRKQLEDVPRHPGMSTKVTGPAAMFHDVNRNSSADLLRAELIGVPLTLVILLMVFGSPVAAGLALALAFAAVTLSAAVLYLLSHWMPVTLFTQNAITIIGLGTGVDYCLFVLYRYREALRRGLSNSDALLDAWRGVGPAVMVAGLAVGVGFLALFLVNARVLQCLAVGGLLVTFSAVAAAVTLLPVLLACLGERINWSTDSPSGSWLSRALHEAGGGLARRVVVRPWGYLVASLVLVTAIAAPALEMKSWSVGVTDLPSGFEARDGYDLLGQHFERGWMGPVVLLMESERKAGISLDKARRTVLAIVSALERDGRVAQVHGFAGNSEGSTDEQAPNVATPGPSPAIDNIPGRSRSVAFLNVIPRYPPESREMMELVRELRTRKWHDAESAGITVKVGGASALIRDFDTEILESLWRVVPAVLAVSFFALLFFFRSILIPLKAIAMNLLSVLAAYGFLVLVFQHDFGLGAAHTGGLNSFVVLMLFTILFGLSMDYEVILLRQIQEEYERSGDNASAIARGLGGSAGVISSAAAIMVCLFGSLLFTELAATRQFGVGMAFAVALDVSVIRVLIVPASMVLLGRANWWFPGRARSNEGRTPERSSIDLDDVPAHAASRAVERR